MLATNGKGPTMTTCCAEVKAAIQHANRHFERCLSEADLDTLTGMSRDLSQLLQASL